MRMATIIMRTDTMITIMIMRMITNTIITITTTPTPTKAAMAMAPITAITTPKTAAFIMARA